MRHNKGLILFTTLILMQMLVIISMIFVFQYGDLVKQSAQRFEIEWMYRAGRKFLQQISINPRTYFQPCLIKTTDQQWILQQRKTWWQIHACLKKVKDHEYYYVIESLAKNICALDDHEKPLMVNYYRITLNIFHDHDLSAALKLQHVYAMPSLQSKDCNEQKPHVFIGLQSEQILSMD